MNVAVTGGAGYIGSHAVQHLANAGHRVVAIDNLCTGHRQAIDPRATLVELDLRNTQAVRDVLERYQIEAVLHFAAISVVGDSVHQPLAYWDNNVGGAMSLLTAMASAKVHKLVFSSTCSTYGEPKQMPISESAPQEPQNPYGHTKLAIERLIRDYARAEPQFGYTILRYFNVAGCDMSGRLGEDHRPETHLIPLLLQAAAGVRDSISIYGTDYDTPDGTCIRDYLHVDDLISAHELALNQLRPGAGDAMNLGLGKGFSVRELVDVARSVTGVDFTVHETARRAGDVPVLYANASRARAVLGWKPRHLDLHQIIGSAWRWISAHPRGYASDTNRT